jgi:dienelactone hydrolase
VRAVQCLPKPRRARSDAPYLCWLLMLACWVFSTSLPAWEGHKWDEWRQVETWQKPDLRTDQTGRSDLVPLLGEGTNRITSTAAWEAKRQQLASTIQQILGRPTNLKRPALEVQELGVEELDGYTRRHLKIKTEPDDWIPAYLLVPQKLAAPRVPAMICLHQTMPQGKGEICGISGDPEMAFAVELVKRGYVCIAPDVIGFGERITKGKQPYDNNIVFFRKHPAWSCMGKMNWDVSRVIDYLETLPFVDPKRIGSIGHSHGAYGTLFATAFDPRIAAAVASCGFTTFRSDPKPERWSHLTPLIPQLGFYLPDVASIPFDWQHVLALAAPRKLFVWYTTGDAIFPRTDNLDDLLKDVQSVYALYGASNAVTWRFADGPHKFPRAQREAAYDWLDKNLKPIETHSTASPSLREGIGDAGGTRPYQLRAGSETSPKTASAFFPSELVTHARANAREHAWAAAMRDSLVAAAKPWLEMSDDELWNLMFGNTLKRAWQVWSDGYCPSCKKPVPMYEWQPDALKQPWKMRCPQCKELFPKNDFAKFYRSGLDDQNVFDPKRADRSLLFNTEHPDPADPLHRFGVDDGDGYVADGKRWRFINAYLIFGQWKQAIVAGVRNLAAAYVATGDLAYAHKAAVLLDRIADLYPTFDFGKEGVMYEGAPRSGYVSTWHDACVEVYDLALAYDAIFEALPGDPDLVKFLSAKAAKHKLAHPKSSLGDIRRNIEERIFHDTLANRPKIESNYPMTDKTIATIRTVLGWPGNRAEVLSLLDDIVTKATAVDGVTGEKGLAGYATIGPRDVAELLNWYARSDPDFLREMVRRHPRLHAMFRFHLDTWCLGQYYPRSGDTGVFAMRNPTYLGVVFSPNPGIHPSGYAFLWELYEATGDKDFVRVLYQANGASVDGLPHDLFAANPAQFQTNVAKIIRESGAEIRLPSVNKTGWCLAILRSGTGTNARAAWLDYDSGERHGHADAMTIGLFAKGLDLLPDFGYPPVQYGGWTSPRALWYKQTAAHNTVSVDNQNTKSGTGKTTLWLDGKQFHIVRASGPKLIGGEQYERTLALVDISERDAYVMDIFRVVGGTNHTRFAHGHFGTLATQGISPAPVEVTRYGEVMRNFRRDPKPAAGWSADWHIEDHLKYVPPAREVHLRHTDLTRGAAVELAETWVSVGGVSGTEEAWIPSVLVRRAAERAPLASTFVSVLEPYETKANLAVIRRLALQDAQGKPCPDSEVGVEIRLADGRRDVLLSRNVEIQPASDKALLLEKESGARFDGDLCLIRFNAARQPQRVLFCKGRSLQVGRLVVRAKNDQASFEIDLANGNVPIISGPANEVGLIELAGAKLWPK